MMLRIEIARYGAVSVLRLIGRVESTHVDELRAVIRGHHRTVMLDLDEVSLVDLDAVRFLVACEAEGIELIRCSRYIREWMKSSSEHIPETDMGETLTRGNTTAPTQFLDVGNQRYAYRRFGKGTGLPLLCLQHFTGTLDNWDPAVSDVLAEGRDVILFDNAGLGRSSGTVPDTVAGMATHAMAFLDGLKLKTCDVLGYSLGGMVAQQMVLNRPSVFRRIILVGTAPRGGEDIMHLEKPDLAKYLSDPTLQGYAILQKIFFAPTSTSQTAGAAFVERLSQRTKDLDPPSGPSVAAAQMAAFRDWERYTGKRFADVESIRQPTLVVNGVHDEMIPVRNSYWLVEHLPNAILLVYPDSGHGSLFQFHESFTQQASLFLGD